MRVRVLSILLFLALLVVSRSGPLATPVAPGAPQAPSQEEAEASEGSAASAEESLREFVPSEEVPADSAIAFPVDI